MELTGTVQQVMPTETGEGQNGQWKKNGFVLVYMDGQYEKKLFLSGFNKSAEHIESLKPGQHIKVSFNVESREYNGRWYTDAKAWKVVGENSPAATSSSVNDDDMPF